MKVTTYYLANCTMDIDLPAKYDKIVVAKYENLCDIENALVEEMKDYIDNYIHQIDPKFCGSCGITGENMEWEW